MTVPQSEIKEVLETPCNKDFIHLNISFRLKKATAMITMAFTSLTAI